MAPLTTGGGPLRVLVVDDDTDTVESTIDLLALHGFAVSGACDGDTALRLVLAGRPDVVLTDLLMPGRSGCALARQIRTVGIIPCPVLIAVTGCHGAALQEASTVGFDLILIKPVEPNSLVSILRQLPLTSAVVG